MKKELKKKKAKIIFQIIYSLILLGFLYYLGFPIYYLVILSIIILLVVLLKGKLYRKIDSLLCKVLPFLSKLNPTLKKGIIIIAFILIWILLKQIIFVGFKLAGIDLQKIIIESFNQSAIGSGSSSSGGPGA